MANNNTLDKIFEATQKVISQKTINGTRIHLIAKEAGLQPSNIQYYFKTKNDLFMALLETVLDYFRNERELLMIGSGPEFKDKLAVILEQKKRCILKKKDYEKIHIDFWVQSLIDKKINVRFRKNYETWRGSIRNVINLYMPDLDGDLKEYIPYAMVSMMLGATIQYYVQEDPFDLEIYFSTCLTMILSVIDSRGGKELPPESA
jgi:AcrR family transcriptional regulator